MGRIQLQYLREDERGNRDLISESEYESDRLSKEYEQIHAFGSVIIYKLKERKI